jgi:hypothetical protein
MPPKQRQIKMQQNGGLAAMQQLETRSDEELAREQKFKAAAQAILGARAAERYDAKASREHFRAALAAARPQERMALRRMADASLALAERRPDDLKAAVERLGQTPPSNRQLMLLRFMGLVAPPASAGTLARVRGIAIILGLIVALVLLGTGIAKLIAWPLGGLSLLTAVWVGIVIVIVAMAVMALLGRRRQARAKATRAAAPGK